MRDHISSIPTIIKVYHGTRDPNLVLTNEPLYGAIEYDVAESYARHRSMGGTPCVYTLEFMITKLASDEDIRNIVEKVGGTEDELMAAVATENIEVVTALIQQGFDGGFAWDFGFRGDFDEVQVYFVFDAKKSARILDKQMIRCD